MNSIVQGRFILAFALAVTALAAPAAPLAGQGVPAPMSPAPKPSTTAPLSLKPAGPPVSPEIHEAKPEVYYVRDKDGQLVPVPDFSYEEFKRLYDLDQKLAQNNTPPLFVLQSVQMTGVAGEELADLEIRVRWVIRSESWVRIPLRFSTGVLREVPTYDGPGEHLVEAERGGGFAVWIRERDPAPHTLVLRMRVPVKRQGDEQQLLLPCPTGALSELELSIPKPRLAATLNGGGSLLANENPTPGSTMLKIAGLGENFQVAWRPREMNAVRLLGAIEATVAIGVRIEGPRRVTSDARIKLRGIGSGADTFRVRLPAGMEFIPALEPGYTATLVETLAATSTSRASQIVEVRLDSRGVASAEIHLRAAHPETAKVVPDEPLETLGFEVLGVVRQSGFVEFVVNGEWSLQYGERQSVQPAELSDVARQQGAVSRFEFYRQPCSLVVQVQPKKSRVRVDPTYVMTIGASQARLQASLNYRLSGALTTRLQIDCGSWIIDRVEPERIAMNVTTSKDEPGVLTITWPTEVGPPSRDFELQLFGHLDVVSDRPLTLPIPRPVLDGPNSAAVVIAPEDNVSVTPRLSELAGLVSEPLPPTSTLPARLQSPLYYRARLDADPKRFVADVRPRPRAMSVDLRHSIRIEDSGLRADHQLRYLVANEPVSRLQLTLGRSASARPKFQFFLNVASGSLVPLTAKEIEADGEVVGPQWELTLPEPRIGQLTIVARTVWPVNVGDVKSTREFVVPLLIPTVANDTTTTRNQLRLTAELPWRVEVVRNDWRGIESPEAETDQDNQRFVGEAWYAGPELAASVAIRWGRGTAAQSAFWVHNAWVQTWIGRSTRHDRSVWKLTSHESRVEIQLPPGVDADELITAVDGIEVDTQVDAAGKLRVPLAADGGEHVIEVSCFLPRPVLRQGAMRIELARLVGGNSSPRFLWQLITPRDEHLLTVPNQLNPESKWGWRNGFWERQAAWGQSELERWTGAAPQDDLPNETNQYLFSAVGAIDEIEVRLLPRSFLVLVASAIALFVGLLLIYVRPLRHPLTLSIAGLGLLALTVTLPETAAVVAQAAILGWALTLLARILQVSAGKRAPQIVTRNSRSGVRRSVTEPPVEKGNVLGVVGVSTEAASPPFPTEAAPKS